MENKAKQRYYLLCTKRDLFGTWCLVKVFGSLINHRGRSITQVCVDKKHAAQMLFEAESAKRQRGYTYADLPDSSRFQLRPQTITEVMNRVTHKTISPKIMDKPIIDSLNLNQQELF